MRCTDCGHALPEYDRDGMQTGVTCTHGNRVTIPMSIASDAHCGAWTEAEE